MSNWIVRIMSKKNRLLILLTLTIIALSIALPLMVSAEEETMTTQMPAKKGNPTPFWALAITIDPSINFLCGFDSDGECTVWEIGVNIAIFVATVGAAAIASKLVLTGGKVSLWFSNLMIKYPKLAAAFGYASKIISPVRKFVINPALNLAKFTWKGVTKAGGFIKGGLIRIAELPGIRWVVGKINNSGLYKWLKALPAAPAEKAAAQTTTFTLRGFIRAEAINKYLTGRAVVLKWAQPEGSLFDFYTYNIFNSQKSYLERFFGAINWALDDIMIATGITQGWGFLKGAMGDLRLFIKTLPATLGKTWASRGGILTFFKSIPGGMIKFIRHPWVGTKALWNGFLETRFGNFLRVVFKTGTINKSPLPNVEAGIEAIKAMSAREFFISALVKIENAARIGHICAAFNIPINTILTYLTRGRLPTIREQIDMYKSSFYMGFGFGALMQAFGSSIKYVTSRLPFFNRAALISSEQISSYSTVNRVWSAFVEEFIREQAVDLPSNLNILAWALEQIGIRNAYVDMLKIDIPYWNETPFMTGGLGELFQESFDPLGKPTMSSALRNALLQSLFDLLSGKTNSSPEQLGLIKEVFGETQVNPLRPTEITSAFTNLEKAGVKLTPTQQVQMEKILINLGYEYSKIGYDSNPVSVLNSVVNLKSPEALQQELSIANILFEKGVSAENYANFRSILANNNIQIESIKQENIPLLVEFMNEYGGVTAAALQSNYNARLNPVEINAASSFLKLVKSVNPAIEPQVLASNFAKFTSILANQNVALSSIPKANVELLSGLFSLSEGGTYAAILQWSYKGNFNVNDVEVAKQFLQLRVEALKANPELKPQVLTNSFARFASILSQQNAALSSVPKANLAPLAGLFAHAEGGAYAAVLQISYGANLLKTDIEVAEGLMLRGVTVENFARFASILSGQTTPVALSSIPEASMQPITDLLLFKEGGASAAILQISLGGKPTQSDISVANNLISLIQAEKITPKVFENFVYVLSQSKISLGSISEIQNLPQVAEALPMAYNAYLTAHQNSKLNEPFAFTKADVKVVSELLLRGATKEGLAQFSWTLANNKSSLSMLSKGSVELLATLMSSPEGGLYAGIMEVSYQKSPTPVKMTPRDISVAEQFIRLGVTVENFAAFTSILLNKGMTLSSITKANTEPLALMMIQPKGATYAAILQTSYAEKLTANDILVANLMIEGFKEFGVKQPGVAEEKALAQNFSLFANLLSRNQVSLGSIETANIKPISKMLLTQEGAATAAVMQVSYKSLKAADLNIASQLLEQRVESGDIAELVAYTRGRVTLSEMVPAKGVTQFAESLKTKGAFAIAADYAFKSRLVQPTKTETPIVVEVLSSGTNPFDAADFYKALIEKGYTISSTSNKASVVSALIAARGPAAAAAEYSKLPENKILELKRLSDLDLASISILLERIGAERLVKSSGPIQSLMKRLSNPEGSAKLSTFASLVNPEALAMLTKGDAKLIIGIMNQMKSMSGVSAATYAAQVYNNYYEVMKTTPGNKGITSLAALRAQDNFEKIISSPRAEVGDAILSVDYELLSKRVYSELGAEQGRVILEGGQELVLFYSGLKVASMQSKTFNNFVNLVGGQVAGNFIREAMSPSRNLKPNEVISIMDDLIRFANDFKAKDPANAPELVEMILNGRGAVELAKSPELQKGMIDFALSDPTTTNPEDPAAGRYMTKVLLSKLAPKTIVEERATIIGLILNAENNPLQSEGGMAFAANAEEVLPSIQKTDLDLINSIIKYESGRNPNYNPVGLAEFYVRFQERFGKLPATMSIAEPIIPEQLAEVVSKLGPEDAVIFLGSLSGTTRDWPMSISKAVGITSEILWESANLEGFRQIIRQPNELEGLVMRLRQPSASMDAERGNSQAIQEAREYIRSYSLRVGPLGAIQYESHDSRNLPGGSAAVVNLPVSDLAINLGSIVESEVLALNSNVVWNEFLTSQEIAVRPYFDSAVAPLRRLPSLDMVSFRAEVNENFADFLGRVFNLDKVQLEVASKAFRTMRFEEGKWHPLCRNGEEVTMYSPKVVPVDAEGGTVSRYSYVHEMFHIFERVVSDNLTSKQNVMVLSGLSSINEGISLALPKIFSWYMYQKTGKAEYLALGMTYYNADEQALYMKNGKGAGLWAQNKALLENPGKFKSSLTELLSKGGLVPSTAYVQRKHVGEIGSEYYVEARVLERMLAREDINYDVGKLFKALLVEVETIPVGTDDFRVLKDLGEVQSIGKTLLGSVTPTKYSGGSNKPDKVAFETSALRTILTTIAYSENNKVVAEADRVLNDWASLVPAAKPVVEKQFALVEKVAPGIGRLD